MPAKPVVCSITINSDDEIRAFRKHLGDDFRFVELTEGQAPNDPGWFGKVCRSGIQCDVLVISGHFAGSFYGSSDFSLPLEMLEERSCSPEGNGCAGILARPREVFMFGCNTLQHPDTAASNLAFDTLYERFRRSNFDPQTAVRLATHVKTGLHSTFEERMRRVFSGAARLHGFSRSAPEGPRIAPALDRYFQSVPDYVRHLQGVSRQPAADNRALRAALRAFSYDQAIPIAPGSPAAADYRSVCRLYDPRTSLRDGLGVIDALLGGKHPVSYFHAFERFARERLQSTPRLLRELRNAGKAKTAITAIEKRIGDSVPYATIHFATIGQTMGWIDAAARDAAVKQAVLRLIARKTDTSRNMARQIRDDRIVRFPMTLGVADLPKDFERDPHILEVLGTLGVANPEIVDRLIGNLDLNDASSIPTRLALGGLRLSPPQVERIIAILYGVTDDETQAGIVYLLSRVGCTHPHTREYLQRLAATGHLQPVAREQLEASLPELARRCD